MHVSLAFWGTQTATPEDGAHGPRTVDSFCECDRSADGLADRNSSTPATDSSVSDDRYEPARQRTPNFTVNPKK